MKKIILLNKPLLNSNYKLDKENIMRILLNKQL